MNTYWLAWLAAHQPHSEGNGAEHGTGSGGIPSLSPSTAQESSGGRTLPQDLFRRGNTDSPEADNVRTPDTSPNYDVVPDENGMICPNNGGISTSENPLPGKTWKLPAGTELPEGLQLRNDHGAHWLIEPSRGMTVDDFKKY